MWFPLVLLASSLLSPSEAVPAFPLVFEMTYCYEGEPCNAVEWTFFEDGRMEDTLDGTGDWRARRGDFRLLYDHGSEYRGTYDMTTGCMEGENRRETGETGTWDACML